MTVCADLASASIPYRLPELLGIRDGNEHDDFIHAGSITLMVRTS